MRQRRASGRIKQGRGERRKCGAGRISSWAGYSLLQMMPEDAGIRKNQVPEDLGNLYSATFLRGPADPTLIKSSSNSVLWLPTDG